MSIVVDDFAIFLDVLPTMIYLGMTILFLMRHLAVSEDIFLVTTGWGVLLASFGAEARESAKYPIIHRGTPPPPMRNYPSKLLVVQNLRNHLSYFIFPKSITN